MPDTIAGGKETNLVYSGAKSDITKEEVEDALETYVNKIKGVLSVGVLCPGRDNIQMVSLT